MEHFYETPKRFVFNFGRGICSESTLNETEIEFDKYFERFQFEAGTPCENISSFLSFSYYEPWTRDGFEILNWQLEYRRLMFSKYLPRLTNIRSREVNSVLQTLSLNFLLRSCCRKFKLTQGLFINVFNVKQFRGSIWSHFTPYDVTNNSSSRLHLCFEHLELLTSLFLFNELLKSEYFKLVAFQLWSHSAFLLQLLKQHVTRRDVLKV